MKVPTYRAQTGITSEVGARPMRVGATAETFGAGVSRAQAQLAGAAADVAVTFNEARRAEEKLQRDLQSEQFTNEYSEVVTLAAEEAAQQPVDQQEAFFDNAVRNIQNEIPKRFTDDLQIRELSLNLERYAISKRVGVRANANQGRLNTLLSESATREMNLRNEAINGDPAELARSLADLENLYSNLIRDGLMEEDDVQRRSQQMSKDIQFEREINGINRIETIEQAESYIEKITDDERFDPTERRRLVAAASSMVTGKSSELAAAKSKVRDDIASLNTLAKTGKVIPQKQLNAVDMQVKMVGDEGIARDFRAVVETDQNNTLFNSNPTLAGMDELIEMGEQAPTAGLSAEEIGYQAQFVTDARAYRDEMLTSYQDGKGLEFLSERGIITVTPFDFANPQAAVSQRAAEMNALTASVGVSSTTGRIQYEQNFFTDREAEAYGQYLSAATPLQLAANAQSLSLVAGKYPQIWEQVAGQDGKAKLFAMAGAIDDIATAEKIFQGHQFLIDKTRTNPPKNQYIAVFEDIVGDTYKRPGTAGEDHSLVLNAALAHYASNRLVLDEFKEEEFKSSVRAITGGIGERNGFKFELPRDVEEDVFNELIDEMTPEMLREQFAPAGFDHLNLTDEAAIERIQQSRIVSTGASTYYVVDPATGMVTLSTLNDDGSQSPFEFVITEEMQKYLKTRTVFSVRGPRSVPATTPIGIAAGYGRD